MKLIKIMARPIKHLLAKSFAALLRTPQVRTELEILISGINAQSRTLNELGQTLQALHRSVDDLTKQTLTHGKQLDHAMLRIGARKLRVTFLVQNAETWTSIESAWGAFKRDNRCETEVLVLPFYHEAYARNDVSHYLTERAISHRKWPECSLDHLKPDVVFYQSPYDDTRPPEYAVEEVAKKVDRIAYIPYGLEIGGGALNTKYMFQLPIHEWAWRIFARSENHRSMYHKLSPHLRGEVCVTGHPKFDALKTFRCESIDTELREKVNGRPVVMWNPHFTVRGEMRFSTFLKWHKLFLDEFQKRPNLVLLLRPHPLLFKELGNSGLMTNQDIESFKKHFLSQDNLILDEHSDYRQSFSISSALMSDTSSFLLEYLPTEKPILFLPSPQSPILDQEAPLLDSYYQATSEAEVTNFLNLLEGGQDPKKTERLSQMKHFIYFPAIGVGETIKNTVLRDILGHTNKTGESE